MSLERQPGSDRYRRGLYTFSKRTSPFAMLSTFDAPSGEECVARREVTQYAAAGAHAAQRRQFVEIRPRIGRGRARQISRVTKGCGTRPVPSLPGAASGAGRAVGLGRRFMRNQAHASTPTRRPRKKSSRARAPLPPRTRARRPNWPPGRSSPAACSISMRRSRRNSATRIANTSRPSAARKSVHELPVAPYIEIAILSSSRAAGSSSSAASAWDGLRSPGSSRASRAVAGAAAVTKAQGIARPPKVALHGPGQGGHSSLHGGGAEPSRSLRSQAQAGRVRRASRSRRRSSGGSVTPSFARTRPCSGPRFHFFAMRPKSGPRSPTSCRTLARLSTTCA